MEPVDQVLTSCTLMSEPLTYTGFMGCRDDFMCRLGWTMIPTCLVQHWSRYCYRGIFSGEISI